jgi:hypothetical protein
MAREKLQRIISDPVPFGPLLKAVFGQPFQLGNPLGIGIVFEIEARLSLHSFFQGC